MNSLFDSFVSLTENSYALTTLMYGINSKAILALECMDEHGNRVIELLEFLPSSDKKLSQTWYDTLNRYELTVEKKTPKEIEILNLHAVETGARNTCPQISWSDFSSSSTYSISNEKRQALLTSCRSQEKRPRSCSDSFLCAAHQLKNIGITPPRVGNDGPT